jgi:hypothetical protein
MRFITAAMTAAAISAVAASAFAAPARLSDVQFIAANRCLGIESTKALGDGREADFKSLVKEQQWGRTNYINDQADAARDEANSQASRGGAEQIGHLTAERDGVCRAFLTTTTASTPAQSHSM